MVAEDPLDDADEAAVDVETLVQREGESLLIVRKKKVLNLTLDKICLLLSKDKTQFFLLNSVVFSSF